MKRPLLAQRTRAADSNSFTGSHFVAATSALVSFTSAAAGVASSSSPDTAPAMSSTGQSSVPVPSSSAALASTTGARRMGPCGVNGTNASVNSTSCDTNGRIEEEWVVWKLHSTVAVAVGGVVLAILIAVVAFILHHRQRRRKILQRASSGYSATSFNSSINEAAAQESHANPALQHTCDVYDIDEFSLDNDSFLHTLESFEYAHRNGVPTSSYGRMRGPPAIIHPSSSVAVAPAPLTKLPPNTLDPLSVLSITPATSTISSAGSAVVTKSLSRGNA